jgi:hypothetical protein
MTGAEVNPPRPLTNFSEAIVRSEPQPPVENVDPKL